MYMVYNYIVYIYNYRKEQRCDVRPRERSYITQGRDELRASGLTIMDTTDDGDQLVDAVLRARQANPGCTAKEAYALIIEHGWAAASLAQIKKACSRATSGVVLKQAPTKPKAAAAHAVGLASATVEKPNTALLPPPKAKAATGPSEGMKISPPLLADVQLSCLLDAPLEIAAAAAAAAVAMTGQEVRRLAKKEKLKLTSANTDAGYEGVTFEPARCAELCKPFRARQQLEAGAVRHLGYYSSALEAALGYARALGSEASAAAAAAAEAAALSAKGELHDHSDGAEGESATGKRKGKKRRRGVQA